MEDKVDGALGKPAQLPEVATQAVVGQKPGTILSGLLSGPGRVAFKMEIENGQLVGLNRIGSVSNENGWHHMRDAAKHLGFGYTWLSRHWKGLGLTPKKLGNRLFFAQADLDALIKRQPGPRLGRRAKVVRVYA
jgi:hypothetical protein